MPGRARQAHQPETSMEGTSYLRRAVPTVLAGRHNASWRHGRAITEGGKFRVGGWRRCFCRYGSLSFRPPTGAEELLPIAAGLSGRERSLGGEH